MHELALARAVVDTVRRHAGERRVTAVTLRVGGLRQVVPESLAFYVDLVARGTLAEGARLEQVRVPVRLRCDGCGHEWEPELRFSCPCCGEAGEVLSGEELEVESIEVEEERACTA